MLREGVFLTVMLGVQALVVLHWFVWPHSAALGALALCAAAVMTVMALGNVLLLAGVLRKRAQDPRRRRELEELGQIEAKWLALTGVQFAFIAAALLAGVTLLAAVLAVGHGAELLAMALARGRVRGAAGAAPSSAARA